MGGQKEGAGCLRWRKDRERESMERAVLIKGTIMGLARNLTLENS